MGFDGISWSPGDWTISNCSPMDATAIQTVSPAVTSFCTAFKIVVIGSITSLFERSHFRAGR